MKRNRSVSRREFLVGGSAALGALLLPGCNRVELPPNYGNILRMADALTYAAHRTLLPGQKLAREYSLADVTAFPAIGTTDPGNPERRGAIPEFWKLQQGGFTDWRLKIEGLVARPGEYSVADLKRYPSRTQITRHTCEEGWTAIAEWTGVALSRVLETAGMLPAARYVTFYSFDDWVDTLDLFDALHPQTLLAYGMNGQDLLVRHGGPVRLRVETQLGFKSMKFIRRIVVRNEFDDGGKSGSIQNGWSWYGGI